MKKKDPISTIKKVINKSSQITIVTHWSPDGDAMGSSLALYHYLRKLKKKVKVVVPNDYPTFLNWLPANKTVLNFQKNTTSAKKFVSSSDLIFILDFNTLSRIDQLGDEVKSNQSAQIIMVDHHQQPDDFADYYFHDTAACSTCELVYQLIVGVSGKQAIDKKIASCLYTGIMTDTGNFRFNSVTSETHKIVSVLIEKGADNSAIYSAVQDNFSFSRIRLIGYCLSEKLKLVPGLNAAYICLTQKEQDRFNFVKGDTENLVNFALSISGMKLSAFFTERDGIIKISFRSKGSFDVNLFARKHWEGGGHKNAAGGQFNKSMDECESKFLSDIREYSKQLS
ncbi:MAG: DHH family phosphoesterase [Bacteroidota bacterium]|jgi:phosphoesterase RecJ-like protein